MRRSAGILTFADLLKQIFGRGGRFDNISLLTSSIPNFLNMGSPSTCATDHVHPKTLHPTTRGIAMFADLLIWQFLHHLHAVIAEHCPRHARGYAAHNSATWEVDNMPESKHHFSDSDLFKRNNDSLYSEQRLHIAVKPAVGTGTGTATGTATVVIPRAHIHAALVMHAPLTSKILPASVLAIMCIDGGVVMSDSGMSEHGVFEPFELPHRHRRPLWIEFDLVVMMAERCAGWAPKGFRSLVRVDDEYMYSPTSIRHCARGGGSFMPQCDSKLFREWPEGKYPHARLGSKFPPGLQESDIVVRVASSMQWEYTCFVENCAPDVHWMAPQGNWHTEHLQLNSPPGIPSGICSYWSGMNITQSGTNSVGPEFVYVSWPAERCFPWKYGATGEFQGAWVAREIMFASLVSAADGK